MWVSVWCAWVDMAKCERKGYGGCMLTCMDMGLGMGMGFGCWCSCACMWVWMQV